jgi:hypothetical protein
MVAFWTSLVTGFVIVPVNAHLVPEEMAYVVDNAGELPRLLPRRVAI